MKLDSYATEFFDEILLPEGKPRPGTDLLVRRLEAMTTADLQRRQLAADVAMLNMGITFSVYGTSAGSERILPFDIIPRIIDRTEWAKIEAGLKQRIQALNLFIDDLYGDQRIVRDRVVPEELIVTAKTFRPECRGIRPPGGVWCHVTGTDLVRDRDGQVYVLEDNLRVPSGVSYVLENREVMKRTFPQVFSGLSVAPVEDYPERLLEMLQSCAPPSVTEPNIVVLTPGVFNSAYFEHSFLAQQMGVELVQGSDLIVAGGYVCMRTTRGLRRVDVIYRRIDDDFLDPRSFRADSMLGVSGLMEVYRAGRVTLCNAPGTGVADDKAVYAYVPQIIRYYLGEDAILQNVPTYLCSDAKQREYVLAHMDELVHKPTNESGGYGILVGPRATKEELSRYAEQIMANPRGYIAQPMLRLSTVPTIIDGQVEARHVDLRPFILHGKEIYVLPGGLTRVALRKGSTIVNSSQGGGSKDTWVLSASPTNGRSRGEAALVGAASGEFDPC
jgi:uncharacterized circularly permuted ATP-grasp superfamily protein